MRTNDKLEKCVHSVVLLCSICRNFYRTKSICGQYQFFVFAWRKLLLNHIDYFEKPMVNMLHCKKCVSHGLDVLKVVTSTQDKEHGRPSKNSKMWNWNRWTKMIRKHKNISPSKWTLVNKMFSIGFGRRKRFRYHISWTTGKWNSAKTHVIFCSLDTKGSRFCIV